MSNFGWLAQLPLDGFETVAAMTVWTALGKNCIVIATDLGRMFVLRINDTGQMDIAGPLEFAPADAVIA